MKNFKISFILSRLRDDGWKLIHQEGSHRQFKHSFKPGKVTVNGKESDDVCGKLLKSIERQSGLSF